LSFNKIIDYHKVAASGLVLFIVPMQDQNDQNEIQESDKIPKIVLLLVTGVFLLFPVFSIIGKLQKSIGNQPKMVSAIIISMVLISMALVLPVWFTRPRAKKESR
jgi:quinol-cytochrome oxidoreductase complex cytochrome b subunit